MNTEGLERIVHAIIPDYVGRVGHKCRAMTDDTRDFINVTLNCAINFACNLILYPIQDEALRNADKDKEVQDQVKMFFGMLIEGIENYRNNLFDNNFNGIVKMKIGLDGKDSTQDSEGTLQ